MRLINVSTLQLEEFMDSRHAPPYAILSHTWGEGEVTFQDFAYPDIAQAKKGYGKIEQTCKRAKASGIGYAWVDTCCIDKTSSAELTEAINSMFQWYAQSQVCYAWLADLKVHQPIESFASCRWFSRGWTLQELIAPREVEFYDEAWIFHGTKADLSDALQKVTGIDGDVLRVGTIGILSTIPLARRMSWASDRVTTRLEDAAYCLLGIFGVNMPLLYGEGERAFIRLQEEIIKESNDLSLLAWTLPSDPEAKLRLLSLSADESFQTVQQEYHGILAASPACFKDASDIVSGDEGLFDETYVMTNKGLQIAVDVAPLDNASVMPLHCVKSTTGHRVAINLRQYGTRQYARCRSDALVLYTDWVGTTPSWQRPSGSLNLPTTPSVFLSKTLTAEQATTVARSGRWGIMLGPGFFSPDWQLSSMAPGELYDNSRRLFLTRGQRSFVGYMQVVPVDATREFLAKLAWVVFGLENGQPWVTVWSTQSLPIGTTWVKDLKTLAKNARGVITDHVVLENARRTRKLKVLVGLEESTLGGEPVYVVDIRRSDIKD
jgi:hypothetical protein